MELGELQADIRAGMEENEIMQKYGLTQRQLQEALRKMMISGHLSESELFEWLKLTESQFFVGLGQPRRVIDLYDDDRPGDLSGRNPLQDHLAGMGNKPEYAITHIQAELPVFNFNRATSEGLVRDLSVSELRVASKRRDFFNVGEPTILHIYADLLGASVPITLEAACSWVERRGKRRHYYVGNFEVTRISEENLGMIKDLIRRLLSRRDRGRPRYPS